MNHKPLLFALLMFLTACQNVPTISVSEGPVPSQQLKHSFAGIHLRLEETEFDNSPSNINTMLINTSNYSCTYGEFYRVEINKENKWHSVNYSDRVFDSHPNFTDLGYTLNPNEKVSQDFSLKRLKITLPEGRYRLTKTFICPSQQGREITVSVPFQVGKRTNTTK